MTRHIAARAIFTIALAATPFAYGQSESSLQGEIKHLMHFVESSECQFIRNGKAYNGQDAVAHIQRKYDYFKKRIKDTETFIELSATKSTYSNKPYTIQCPGEAVKTSGDWLTAELQAYRQVSVASN
ncbi:DUF5329 domain-containing protein [Vibrio sp. JC009]|uniref:DUF5329 domain-containing protein n=1 Tax=Vibrio sp. JC009 TaxID=2912314 RepID=UPI0023B1281F|nr:DUF5329 domain-containing protein [Vibrio sp. JC009]WED23226.1 DUF5329 domain-containing protein [Vibrio sp. JC009]